MIDLKPDSVNNKFRAARVEKLRELIALTLKEKETCRILDVGGTYNFWHVWRDKIDWKRCEIVCVNIDPHHFEHGKDGTRITMIQGNACNLSSIADKEFDIAFSNSVIEHVGRWPDMVNMANEVKRVAKRYLLQTPNYWFPIEPHARTPFLHWLPRPIAYRIVMMRKCGHWQKATTVSQAVRLIESNQMLDFRQMKELFGDAELSRERFLGWTKSLIAIRA